MAACCPGPYYAGTIFGKEIWYDTYPGCDWGGNNAKWGADCAPNYDGQSGTTGENGEVISEKTFTEVIDKRVVLNIPYILQDMLLKYAIGLQVKILLYNCFV